MVGMGPVFTGAAMPSAAATAGAEAVAGTAGITAAAAMECGPAGARMAARVCVPADGRLWVAGAGRAVADRVAADGPVAAVMAVAATAAADTIAKT